PLAHGKTVREGVRRGRVDGDALRVALFDDAGEQRPLLRSVRLRGPPHGAGVADGSVRVADHLVEPALGGASDGKPLDPLLFAPVMEYVDRASPRGHRS